MTTQPLILEAEPLLRRGHRLRVLLVPDSIHWITGTIARSIVTHNAWLDGTIISGAVLDIVARDNPQFFDSFDIVHFVCPYASRKWLPILRNRLPVVTSHHHVSDDWALQQHNLGGDAIIVGSSQWASDVIERGASPKQVTCIPYGVDASRFVPASAAARQQIRQSLGIASDAVVVGFFAKMSSNERDRKGTDVFAAAVQLLSSKLPTLVVLIIGPGWNELIAQLESAGVKCVWLPFVRESSRMPEMFQALDFYWVTARVEGGPVTLLEAMSTGVCCITTPVGLARDIVDHRTNGIVVGFDDAEAFALETLSCSSRKAEREVIGTRARDTILRTMDVPVTSQGVRKAYEIAFAQFDARNTHNTAITPDSKLWSLPAQLLARIDVLEQLIWAEALILQGQRSLALKMIIEAWARNPFSTYPPRYLLRNVLPRSVVGALVRAKTRVTSLS